MPTNTFTAATASIAAAVTIAAVSSTTRASEPEPTEWVTSQQAAPIRIASTRVHTAAHAAELIALDAAGNTVGVLTVSSDAEGRIVRFNVDFDDGYATFTLDDGELIIAESTLDHEMVGDRVQAIFKSPPQEGKVTCGLLIAATLAACATPALLAPLACAAGAGLAFCECLPEVKPGQQCK